MATRELVPACAGENLAALLHSEPVSLLLIWGSPPRRPQTTPGLGPAQSTARVKEGGGVPLGSFPPPSSTPGPLGSLALALLEPLGSSGEGFLSLPESLSRRLICLIKRRVFENFGGGARGRGVHFLLVLPGSRLQPRPCSFCQGARCCRKLGPGGAGRPLWRPCAARGRASLVGARPAGRP